MRVLVTGAGGLLGKDVWSQFEKQHELIAIGRNQPSFIPSSQWRTCDLTQSEQTYQTIFRENPDLVIHNAAFNDVDGAEKNPAEAFRGNSLSCRNLALACQRFDTVLMSVSTDYVFDGDSPPSGGYREFDKCRPVSHYGESKRWGELFVSQLLNKFFIIRTSWLFGPGRETWVDKVATAVRDGASVTAVTDMSSAPTYTPDLAQAMLTLAEGRHYGIYHLTNSDFCTRVELAEEIAKIHHRSKEAKIKKVTQSELGLPARRPKHSGLQNLAWTLDGHSALPSWKDALVRHFEKASVLK